MKKHYKVVVLSTFLVLLLLLSANAERRVFDRILRERIPVGYTEIVLPDTTKPGRWLFEDRQHTVEYDTSTGMYVYTYWRQIGNDVQERKVRYEPGNKLDLTIAVSVRYDQISDEYEYTYLLKNKTSSQQPVRMVVVDQVDPSDISKVDLPVGWHFFSGPTRSKDAPIWCAFSTLGNHVIPGEESTIKLYSKLGPMVTTCYAKGDQKWYSEYPDEGVGPGSAPPNEEGVRGKSIGPGTITETSVDVQIKGILSIAREWGWIDSANYAVALNRIPTYREIDRQQFEALLRDFGAPKPGVEPEIPALLTHIGRQKFGLE